MLRTHSISSKGTSFGAFQLNGFPEELTASIQRRVDASFLDGNKSCTWLAVGCSSSTCISFLQKWICTYSTVAFDQCAKNGVRIDLYFTFVLKFDVHQGCLFFMDWPARRCVAIATQVQSVLLRSSGCRRFPC